MKNNKHKNTYGKWIFLSIVLFLLLGVFLKSPNQIQPILNSYFKVILQIAPIFILVYFFMLLTHYFVSNKFLKKHLGKEAGIKGWILAILAGILSMGPIYMWYPLLHDLQSKGMQNKFIATFLYNRGIKLQWLPMLVLYFGLKYALVVLFVMLVLSIPQGILTEKLVNRKTLKK